MTVHLNRMHRHSTYRILKKHSHLALQFRRRNQNRICDVSIYRSQVQNTVFKPNISIIIAVRVFYTRRICLLLNDFVFLFLLTFRILSVVLFESFQNFNMSNQFSVSDLSVGCVICTYIFDDQKQIVITSCGHLYHENCLKKWLESARE